MSSRPRTESSRRRSSVDGVIYVTGAWSAVAALDPNGRPIENQKARNIPPEGFLIHPGPPGARDWPPMVYNPKTGLVYIPTERNEQLMLQEEKKPAGKSIRKIRCNVGYNMTGGVPERLPKGALPEVPKGRGGGLLVWDPVKQEARWSIELACFMREAA